MSEVLIKVDHVSKKFCKNLKRSMLYGIQDIAQAMIGSLPRTEVLKPHEFWAFDDISFELKRGECMGLIGPNGSGKSTLLKVLNGIISPDKGRVEIRGKVGALIEVGAGFHPMLTGRENIYISGAILGFSKQEIDRKFDAIVDFAELDDFIDTPVKNYSSGMYVRLGFAVAAQMEPDVLLIDEVLAVGDAAFRTKCIQVVAEMAKKSAIIFVSHAMPMVGRMCNKALLMHKGKRVVDTFDVPGNILEYLKLNHGNIEFVTGEDVMQIDSLHVKAGDQMTTGKYIEINKLDDFELSIKIKIKKEVGDFLVNLAFLDQEEKNVAETFSIDSGFYMPGGLNAARINARFERLSLNTGKYFLQIGIVERKPDGMRGDIYYAQRGLLEIVVKGQSIGYAPVQLGCEWSMTN